MSLDPASKAKFNLKKAVILVVESDPLSMNIMNQILNGFGARNIIKCDTIAGATSQCASREFDLIISEATVQEAGDGLEFVTSLRRHGTEPNRYSPVLIVSGHTRISHITHARDCGAHFMVAKPLTPIVMLERIIWMARSQRSFVTCDDYAGPDRRFKSEGPPEGMEGRRMEDRDPGSKNAIETDDFPEQTDGS